MTTAHTHDTAVPALALKEGRDAWRGEGCCGPAGQAHADESVACSADGGAACG